MINLCLSTKVEMMNPPQYFLLENQKPHPAGLVIKINNLFNYHMTIYLRGSCLGDGTVVSCLP